MKDRNWIKDEVVLTIHEQQLAEHGGSLGFLVLTTLIHSLSLPATPCCHCRRSELRCAVIVTGKCDRTAEPTNDVIRPRETGWPTSANTPQTSQTVHLIHIPLIQRSDSTITLQPADLKAVQMLLTLYTRILSLSRDLPSKLTDPKGVLRWPIWND